MDYFIHDDYCCGFKTWPVGTDSVGIAGFGTSRREARQDAIAWVSCGWPGSEVGQGSRWDAWTDTDWNSRSSHPLTVFSAPVRAWFEETFPRGPDPRARTGVAGDRLG